MVIAEEETCRLEEPKRARRSWCIDAAPQRLTLSYVLGPQVERTGTYVLSTDRATTSRARRLPTDEALPRGPGAVDVAFLGEALAARERRSPATFHAPTADTGSISSSSCRSEAFDRATGANCYRRRRRQGFRRPRAEPSPSISAAAPRSRTSWASDGQTTALRVPDREDEPVRSLL